MTSGYLYAGVDDTMLFMLDHIRFLVLVLVFEASE